MARKIDCKSFCFFFGMSLSCFFFFHSPLSASSSCEPEDPCLPRIEEASYCEQECDVIFPLPYVISIGPEIYHVQRTREGGTKQDGWIYGVRATYNDIKRYKIYWGIDALYAKGELNGHSGSGDKIKSTFKDENFEGRVGYTFQRKSEYQQAFTPFIGYGYLQETTKFQHPTPMHIKFQNRFKYIAYGFISSIVFNSALTFGANFKAMMMIDARCKVSEDPHYDDRILMINDEFNYRYELPVIYRFSECWPSLEFEFVPFYETRHYGRKENFPFDFLETRVRIYGIDLKINYRF